MAEKARKSNMFALPVDEAQMELLKKYKDITGAPIAKQIREAIALYTETVLAVRIRALTSLKKH